MKRCEGIAITCSVFCLSIANLQRMTDENAPPPVKEMPIERTRRRGKESEGAAKKLDRRSKTHWGGLNGSPFFAAIQKHPGPGVGGIATGFSHSLRSTP